MAWVAALVAAAYQGYNSHKKNQQAKAANKRNEAMLNTLGPDYFNNAIMGFEGGNQYQKDLTGIAQGTYFDPLTLAKPINMLNKAGDTNMQRVTAQLGRSNMSGGLANAYALANTTTTQGNKANLVQNYGLWRENQRRKDLDWINNMRGNEIGRKVNLQRGIEDAHQNTTNPWADSVGSFLGSYAGSSNQGNFFQGFGSTKDKSSVQVGPYKDPYKDSNNKQWWS